jgi:Uma2 family endonuclease
VTIVVSPIHNPAFAMSTAQALITVEEFSEMDFEGPVELVRGEIVELTWSNTWHGYVCAKVAHLLQDWNTYDEHGFVICNNCGVLTERDPDTLRGPDVYFIRHGRLPGGKLPERWIEVPPNLAVEVFSPIDRWRDIWDKIHEYFALGVNEVWVIDPRKRTLHVMKPDDGPQILGESQTLESPDVLAGFSCPVGSLLPPHTDSEEA